MIKKIKNLFFNKNFIIFVVIGVINTLVYNGLYLLGLLIMPYMVSNIVSYIISMTVSFFLNCKYNFKVKPTLKKYCLFPLTGLATFICQTGGLFVLVDLVGWDKRICGFIASLIAIPITFVLMKYILKKDTKSVEESLKA